MTLPDLARTVLDAARSRGLIIATAESCTGGMIAAALTDIAGASDVVDCGFVTYSNRAKTRMLGVREATIARVGAVSEEVAAEMAQGALDRSGADIAVSVTGVAGPGGTPAKPEGMVCFGLATAQNGVAIETRLFGALGRENVRRETVLHALECLHTALLRHAAKP